MYKGRFAVCLFVMMALSGIAFADGSQPPAHSKGEEHDFGDKVLLVGTRPRLGLEKGASHVLEKARVQRLGNLYFLVGRFVDLEGDKRRTGVTFWTPLADVDQITEFESVEAVRKAFGYREKKDKVDR